MFSEGEQVANETYVGKRDAVRLSSTTFYIKKQNKQKNKMDKLRLLRKLDELFTYQDNNIDMPKKAFAVCDPANICVAYGRTKRGEKVLKTTKPEYETEAEDFAFFDGVKAGVKAMSRKFNISESEIYKNDDLLGADEK